MDPVEFGRLIEAVETLGEKLEETSEQMKTLGTRLSEVENRYRAGKAFLVGVLVCVGFALYGVKDALSHLFSLIKA